jgi:hypothetical protein
MLTHRRRRVAAMAGLVLSLVAVGVILAGSGDAAPKTKRLHGKMENIRNFFAPACTSVTGVCSSFDARGDIKGAGVVQIDTFPAPQGPSPTPAYSGAHTVIHTKKGDLTCTEAALFDLTQDDHAFVDECIITGGTGIYAGATGYIQEVGTFDFAANLGELEYDGKITYADKNAGSFDDD